MGADIPSWPDSDEAIALLAVSDEAVAVLADSLEQNVSPDAEPHDPALTDAILDAALGRGPEESCAK